MSGPFVENGKALLSSLTIETCVLTGFCQTQNAKHPATNKLHPLKEQASCSVNWHGIGLNGVTARRTIDELIPLLPKEQFDYILVALGGNDVMKLSSPRKWRRDMIELLGILREKSPDAVIFLANCPM